MGGARKGTLKSLPRSLYALMAAALAQSDLQALPSGKGQTSTQARWSL